MAEQRYQAVLAVISDGETVTEVAARFGVSRKTCMAGWPGTRPAGLENLGDRSHRPRSCPHQMAVGGGGGDGARCGGRIRRGVRGGWCSSWPGAGVEPVPSESAVYRALVRLNLIDPAARRPTGPEVEAVGARGADGVVADGRGRRVRARRRQPGQGVDRGR